MTVFYAFCRTMDDIADEPGIPTGKRARRLGEWETGLREGFPEPDELQREIVQVRDRRGIPTDLLVEIIEGCRMDLEPRRYETWEDLEQYTRKVACAVGLVSIRLFGCRDSGAERYAIALGHALQLTNIIRDVGEDLENGGRIYLPLADLARFGLGPDDLIARRHDGRLTALLEYEAARAEKFFREADAALPAADCAALLPARVMAAIYRLLLDKMRAGGFRVLDKRHRVSKVRKLAVLARHLLTSPRRIESPAPTPRP